MLRALMALTSALASSAFSGSVVVGFPAGKAEEPHVGVFQLADDLAGIVLLPAAHALDELRLRPHLLADRFEIGGVGVFVHQPIDLSEHPRSGHLRALQIVAAQPDDAVGLGRLGRLVDSPPAAVQRPALKLRRLLRRRSCPCRETAGRTAPRTSSVRSPSSGPSFPSIRQRRAEHPVESGSRRCPSSAGRLSSRRSGNRDTRWSGNVNAAGGAVALVGMFLAHSSVGADAEIAHHPACRPCAQVRVISLRKSCFRPGSTGATPLPRYHA